MMQGRPTPTDQFWAGYSFASIDINLYESIAKNKKKH